MMPSLDTNTPKKIAIFGSYNATSIGDTAILLGLLSSLERIYGNNLEVNVLVMNYIEIARECMSFGIRLNIHEIVITEFQKATDLSSSIKILSKKIINKFLYKQVVKDHTLHNALQDVDYLLIGGGNLIMDLYSEGPLLIKKICDAAISQKVSYSFVGVGAGPIYTQKGKEILNECMQNANSVFFRDKNSLSLVKNKFDSIQCSLMPDLALGLNINNTHVANRDNLIINVASVFGKGWPIENNKKFRQYIENLVTITKQLITSIKFKKVILYYSNYPLDSVGGKEYINALKNENIEIEVIDKKLSVADIIELGTTAKLALVTRLHAGIMVYLGGAPVVSVVYHQKVKDVMEGNKISSYFFDINFTNKNKIVQQIINELDDIQLNNRNEAQKRAIDESLVHILGSNI